MGRHALRRRYGRSAVDIYGSIAERLGVDRDEVTFALAKARSGKERKKLLEKLKRKAGLYGHAARPAASIARRATGAGAAIGAGIGVAASGGTGGAIGAALGGLAGGEVGDLLARKR